MSTPDARQRRDRNAEPEATPDEVRSTPVVWRTIPSPGLPLAELEDEESGEAIPDNELCEWCALPGYGAIEFQGTMHAGTPRRRRAVVVRSVVRDGETRTFRLCEGCGWFRSSELDHVLEQIRAAEEAEIVSRTRVSRAVGAAAMASRLAPKGQGGLAASPVPLATPPERRAHHFRTIDDSEKLDQAIYDAIADGRTVTSLAAQYERHRETVRDWATRAHNQHSGSVSSIIARRRKRRPS